MNKAGYPTNDMASGAFTPVNSNTVNLAVPAYGMYVGGDGDLKVMMVDDSIVTFVGLSAGTFLPIIVVRVYSTGTTASNLLGFK